MARLYLDADESYILASPATVYGRPGGSERIIINGGVLGVTLDQNVERVELAGNSSTFQYQQSGNMLKVYAGTSLIATIPLQDDTDGTQVVFSDGAVSAKVGAGGMTLGGSTVSSSAAGSVTPITLTTWDTSSATGTTTPTGGGGGTGGGTTSLLTNAQALSATISTYDTLLSASSPVILGVTEGATVKWNSSALTYSFNTSAPSEYSSDASYTNNWTPLNDTEKTAARSAFTKLAEIVPVSFTETSGTGDIRFNVVETTDSAGFAVVPSGAFGSGVDGDIFLALANRTSESSQNYLPKDYGYLTLIHEIGHAVGIKHTFQSPTVPAGTDSHDYSVMSYTDSKNYTLSFTTTGSTANYKWNPVAEPDNYGVYDIAGLQSLYGANTQTRTGSNTYTVNSHNYEHLAIWDAGGVDTINASTATGACTVNLNPGTLSTIDLWSIDDQKTAANTALSQQGFNNSSWVNSIFDQNSTSLYTGANNLSIAYGAIVENATTGSGSDTVTDNKVDNTISTGTGNDTITLGYGGFDTVDGGAGSDTVILSNTTRSQVQQERLSDGSLLILTSTFAAKLIGVESVTCTDGALTLLA